MHAQLLQCITAPNNMVSKLYSGQDKAVNHIQLASAHCTEKKFLLLVCYTLTAYTLTIPLRNFIQASCYYPSYYVC